MEYVRTGKLIIMGAVFFLFGLMNPAVAKLTPFLMEKIASDETLGMVITIQEVSAVDSWTQFYKNIPMALIVFVLLFGGVLTTEIQKQTLIQSLTKGLSRGCVICTKGFNLILVWSIGYWCCYGITYFYTDFYWDNGIMHHLGFAAMCYWMFGLLIMALVTLGSAIASSFGGVILFVGGLYFAMTLISLVPKIARFLPVYLTQANPLLSGADTSDYLVSLVVSVIVSLFCFVAGCLIFHKKEL